MTPLDLARQKIVDEIMGQLSDPLRGVSIAGLLAETAIDKATAGDPGARIALGIDYCRTLMGQLGHSDPSSITIEHLTGVQRMGDDDLKALADRVRKAVLAKFGSVRGGTFFLSNADIVTLVLRETWIGVRESIERKIS